MAIFHIKTVKIFLLNTSKIFYSLAITSMERSKLVAIITGAISIIVAIAYLIMVQILDYRDMKPAPMSEINSSVTFIVTLIELSYKNF